MADHRFIIAGGGTGGHLFPAIAVADEIKRREPGAAILFVGTKDRLESRVVPEQGYQFGSIWVSPFHRRRIGKNLLFPVKLITSIMQARSIVKNFKPDVVVGTGGYVSGPTVYAATTMHIPTVILDQNVRLGVTTRLLGPRVDEVYLTYEASRQYLRRSDNVIVTGNPTRNFASGMNREAALAYFGFDGKSSRRTVLAFGGSLGAHTVNRAVEACLGELMKSNTRLIWQTGNDDFESIATRSASLDRSSLWVGRFIDRMDYAYFLSDLVVCRAGATTVAELSVLGKPAVLIPYPHAAANHQALNAEELAKAGAARVVYDSEAVSNLQPLLLSLLDDENALRGMREASKKLGKPEAAHTIVDRVLELARRPKAAVE